MKTSVTALRKQTGGPVSLARAPEGRTGDLPRIAPGLRARELAARSQQLHAPLAPTRALARTEAVVAAADPFGEEADSFRELRTELLESVFEDDTRRALAVVSPQRGDGKTYVAANLAVAFSHLGRHTLLIDANMRSPALHRLFGIEQSPGLSSILSRRLETNAVHPSREVPGLFLLPAGPVPPNPLELVQQDGFDFLVQDMLERFDYVIVDTPPTARGSDARVIARAAGAALVVGRKDHSRIADLRRMLGAIGNGPAKLAGVVVNDY